MLSALRTPAGELGAPVKSQHGYYLVKVLERVFPDMGRRAAKRTLFPYATLAEGLDELLALGRCARLPVAPEAPARDLHEVEHIPGGAVERLPPLLRLRERGVHDNLQHLVHAREELIGRLPGPRPGGERRRQAERHDNDGPPRAHQLRPVKFRIRPSSRCRSGTCSSLPHDGHVGSPSSKHSSHATQTARPRSGIGTRERDRTTVLIIVLNLLVEVLRKGDTKAGS